MKGRIEEGAFMAKKTIYDIQRKIEKLEKLSDKLKDEEDEEEMRRQFNNEILTRARSEELDIVIRSIEKNRFTEKELNSVMPIILGESTKTKSKDQSEEGAKESGKKSSKHSNKKSSKKSSKK